MQAKWEQNVGQIARLGLKSRFYSSMAVNLTAFLTQMASISVVIFGVYKISEGELTTGGLIACTILTGRALAPIGQIASLLTRYHQARTSLDTLTHMMSLPVEREPGKSTYTAPALKVTSNLKTLALVTLSSRLRHWITSRLKLNRVSASPLLAGLALAKAPSKIDAGTLCATRRIYINRWHGY